MGRVFCQRRGPGRVYKHAMAVAIVDDSMRALVTEAQQGSRSAADQLVREHDGWVRGVIYGVTGRFDQVDDVAQQVWAQVWERLGSLKDPQRLKSWLYSVARNAAIDAGQARRRKQTAGLERVAEVCEQHGDGPVTAAIGDETQRELLRAVAGLPALYREPFVLRHLEDWSYAEIGALLGLPVETVETRLVRARRLLREALKGKVES